MATSVDVLRTITIRAKAEGTSEAVAAIDRARVATKNFDGSVEDVSKSMATNERAIRSLLRSYEEGYSATEKLTKIQKDLSIGVAGARVTQEQANAIYDAATDKILGLSKAEAALAAQTLATAEANSALRAKYDSAYAAGVKLVAVTTEIIKANREAGLSTELATAALQKETQAYNAHITTLERVAQAEKDAAKRTVTGSAGFNAARDRGADVSAFGSEMDRLQAEFDPAFRALSQYNAYLDRLDRAHRVGAISIEVMTARLTEADAAYQREVNAINGVTVAVSRMSDAEERAAAIKGKLQAIKTVTSNPTYTPARDREADANAAFGPGGALDQQMEREAKEAAARAAASAAQWKAFSGTVPVDPNAAASKALGSLSYGKEGSAARSESIDRERAALLPMVAAQNQYNETMARADALLKANGISQQEHMVIAARANGTLLNQTNEFNKATAAAERNTRGTGLNAYAWTNLSYQINDVVTSLASGISPMQTIAQQGGQFFQILQSDQGGVVGGLKSVRDGVLGLLTPARLVFGGITALVLGSVYALYRYQSDMADLRVKAGGIGRATGATVGNINALAPAAGDAAGISTRSAREIAGAFAATGEIGVGMYGDLIKVTKDFAKASGQDLPAATKEIADAFKSPTAGALALNEKLGFLTRSTYEAIRAAEEQGQAEKARRMLLDSVGDATEKAREKLGLFTRAWEGLKKLTSDTVDGVGSTISAAFGIDEAEEKLKRLLATPRVSDSYLFGDNKALDENIRKARAAVDYAKMEGENAYTNKQGLKIGVIVDEANPQLRQLEQLEGNVTKIRNEFTRLGITNPFGPANDTMIGMERAAKQIRADLEAGGAAYAQSSRQAQRGLETVGYTPTAKSAAEIEARATERGIAANLEFRNNNNGDIYAKALASIEADKQTELKTLTETFKDSAAKMGGAFARAPAAVQEQILQATKIFGKIPAEILAAVGEKENAFKLSGPTKVLDKNGNPSTTAWGFGQITIPAEKDIRKIPGMEDFDRKNPDTAILGAAAYLDLRRKWAKDNMVAALDGYGTGPGYASDIYRRAGKVGDVSPEAEMKDTAARADALRVLNQQLENNKKNYGESGALLEANNKSIAEYNAKIAQGVPATDALKRSIEEYNLTAVSIAQQQKLDTYKKDLEFERQQIGRTTEDAAAYSKARGMFGDTNNEASRFVIQQEQINDNLKLTRDLGKEAFSGFTSDLSKGVSVLDALGNAFSRFADKLIAKASDKAFSALFDGIFGGGTGGMQGGGIGGIFSSIFGGSGGIDIGAQAWMPKFAGGGVANRASIFGEAGPEAAVPLPDGRRIPVMLSQPANQNGGVNVIVNNGVSDSADAHVSEGPDGEVIIDMVDKGLAKRTASGRSSLQRAAGASLRG